MQGKTVVPGFNDAHLHPSPVYPFESLNATIDLGPDKVKNVDELVALLKKKADLTPPGLPIRGFGYQDTKLGGHPTRQILDRVSLTHPVIIRHSSGHISAVNSFVLKLAGITKIQKTLPAVLLTGMQGGNPTEYVARMRLSEFFRSGKMKTPDPPKEEEEMEGYRKCFANYMSNGITSIRKRGLLS